jgi:peroxiredoxin Q/BCP
MLRFAARAAGLAAVLSLTISGAVAQDDTKLKVKVGDPFPNVPLQAAQVEKLSGKKAGDAVSIADLKGKTVVVFFYPRALTKGCTIESCGFRDVMKESGFPKDVVILGASNDDVKLQQKFIDTNMLQYPLLADTDMKLIKALGIANPKGNAAQRVTFVVDKQGKIAKIYEGVQVSTHPKEVIEFVKTVK